MHRVGKSIWWRWWRFFWWRKWWWKRRRRTTDKVQCHVVPLHYIGSFSGCMLFFHVHFCFTVTFMDYQLMLTLTGRPLADTMRMTNLVFKEYTIIHAPTWFLVWLWGAFVPCTTLRLAKMGNWTWRWVSEGVIAVHGVDAFLGKWNDLVCVSA